MKATQQQYEDSEIVLGGNSAGYYNPLSYAQPGVSDNRPVVVSYGKPQVNAPAPPMGDLLCPFGCSTAERSGTGLEVLSGGTLQPVVLGSGRPPVSTSFAPLPSGNMSTSVTNGEMVMQKYLTGKNILLAIAAYVAAKHFKVI